MGWRAQGSAREGLRRPRGGLEDGGCEHRPTATGEPELRPLPADGVGPTFHLLLSVGNGADTEPAFQLTLAPDATIGELADHLAREIGCSEGLTVEGFARKSLVSQVGPRSGSSIRLVEESSDRPKNTHQIAPAHLVFSLEGGTPSTRRSELSYGLNELGAFDVRVGQRLEVVSLPSARILVNGQPVIGSCRLRDGDLVAVLDAELRGSSRSWSSDGCFCAFAVEISGTLIPPIAGPTVPHRSARRAHDEFVPPNIEVPSPPEAARLPAMPLISAAVPLLLGAALWAATRSVASAMFVLFSFVYVVAAGFESRREFKKELEFREMRFAEASARSLQAVADAHASEAAYIDFHSPDPAMLEALIRRHDERIWERSVEDSMGGSLTVRLGRATRRGGARVGRPNHGRFDLLDAFAEALEASERSTFGTVVDMDLGGGLGLIGTDEATTELAQWLILQLVALNGPDELALIIACAPERGSTWSWSAWLPHLCTRNPSAARVKRTVVVVDGATDQEVLDRTGGLDEATTRFLWLAPSRGDLPRAVVQSLDLRSRTLVSASKDGADVFTSESMENFISESVPTEVVAAAGRALAPLVPHRPLEPATATSEGSVPLSTLVGSVDLDDPTTVLQRWAESSRHVGLRAPVARRGVDTVELDLVRDGPHGLVAGMTGSGKSELLRTWLTSIALQHPPRKVTFLLIDYKGGSAFGALSELPHSVGLITDLDPDLAERAVLSLRAELTSRERWLATAGASSMVEASGVRGRPPSLLVVVDEFATLAKEIPHFVEELVDIAQRGRSLGIHLVLATQRPHGVVSESIRANTSLRIALRVADPQDSIDVVGVPDACEMDRTLPGSAIIGIDQSRSDVVRFAYSSGPRIGSVRIQSRPLSIERPGAPRCNQGGPTEIEVAVETVRRAFTESGDSAPRPPWVAPLPDQIHPDMMASFAAERPEQLLVGLVDRPDLQRIEPFVIDLEATTGVLVYGSPGSGRSAAIATIAAAAIHQIQDVLVYSIGARVLHAADCLELSDTERVLRVLRGALARCSGSENHERLVIAIDDLALFEQRFESVNRGEAMRILEQLSRQGSEGRVNLVLGASRRMDVDPALAVGLGCQVTLKVASEDEAALLGAPAALAGRLPAGRGLHQNHWVHFAMADVCGEMCSSRVPLPSLPKNIMLEDLGSVATGVFLGAGDGDGSDGDGRLISDNQWQIPVGLNTDNLQTLRLDLTHSHGVVAGPRRSGRSSALTSIAESFRRRGSHGGASHDFVTVLIEPHSASPSNSDGTRWTRRLSVGATTDAVRLEAAATFIEQILSGGQSVLVAVEELPELLDGEASSEIEAFLTEVLSLGRTRPLRVVVSGEIEAMARCYSPLLAQVRSGRTGILLRPDIDCHGTILGCELERRDERPDRAGVGWLINGGDPEPLQLAVSSAQA